jgi:HK97 gp10 family phage protein
VKTGFLRDHEVRSIKATGGGTIVAKVGPQAQAGYFTLSTRGGKMQGSQSAHYPSLYAMWYEFGTKHQPARPVMGPAAEANQGAVINAFIAELNAQLGKFS